MLQRVHGLRDLVIRSLLLVWVFCASPAIVGLAQSPPPPSPGPIQAAAPTTATSSDDHYLREGLKSIAENSSTLIGWGLALVGASVIAIASTSYFRPVRRKIRSIYLLFIPGWFFIALSVYNGDKISRRYTATAFAQKRDSLLQIGNYINTEFDSQLTYLHIGLIFFSIWLLLFILWWVFGRASATTTSTTGGNS